MFDSCGGRGPVPEKEPRVPVCAQPAPHGSESAGLRAATPGGPPGGGRPGQSVRRAASVGSLGPQAPARGSERWTAGDAGWAPPTPFREEGQSRALENSAPRAGALWPGLVLAPSPRCHLLRGLRSFPWVLPGLSVSRPGLLWIPWPITLSQTPHCFAPCLLISPVWRPRSPPSASCSAWRRPAG